MDRPPFAQTFVGTVLAAVLAALMVWLFTSRQVVRVEVTNAGAIAASPQSSPARPNGEITTTPALSSTTAAVNTNPPSRLENACIEAVIDDPDHYTNVREGPSATDKIVTRLLDGEVFCVTSQKGRWWTIRTTSGITGYIYYDRVRVVASDER
jgi:uncharacterized protein YgiM (DUF1202 family)